MRTSAFLVCWLIPFLLGCGRSQERYIPVEGVVTMDSKPLSGVAVTFEPVQTSDTPPSGRFSVGLTDDSGRFRLKSSSTGQDGAIAGLHRVRFITRNERKFSQQEIEAARSKIIAREKAEGVTNPEVSEQRVVAYLSETTPDSQAGADPIPERYNIKTELTFEVRPDQPNKATFDIQSK